MKILLLGKNQLTIVTEIKWIVDTLTSGYQIDLLFKTACMKKINIIPPNHRNTTMSEQVTFVFD